MKRLTRPEGLHFLQVQVSCILVSNDMSQGNYFLQTQAELKAEAVDYVTGLEDEQIQEPPLPIVALLVDSSPEAAELESLKASVLQVHFSDIEVYSRSLSSPGKRGPAKEYVQRL